MYTLVPPSPRAPPARLRQNSNPTITTRILSVLVAVKVYLYWLAGADKRVMFGRQRRFVAARRQRFGASLLTDKRQIAEYDQGDSKRESGAMETQHDAAMRESPE